MTNNTHQHILLAVTGLSPQVITETIYALHMANKPIPERVVIITTLRGAKEVQSHLLAEGKLAQLCDDYSLPAIKLETQDILVVTDQQGKPMDDATTQQDHIAMSDFICEVVKNLSNNPSTAIHASLAGGRKTMTFLLGYAMSLYGRPQDTLSHILVTEGFESSQFFYPTPYSQQIYLRNGSKDAKDGKVLLAEIPFVRLREDVPTKLLDGSASYSDTVAWLNLNPTNQNIVLDVNQRTLTYCDLTCPLPPADFSFYFWFCQRHIEDKSGLSIPSEVSPDLEYAEEFLQYHAYQLDHFQLEDIQQGTFKQGMQKAYFEERKARVNKAILDHFGERLGRLITINNLGKTHGKSIFSLTLDSEKITILKD